MGIYEQYLAYRIHRQSSELPEHIALVITERDLLERGSYRTLANFVDWALEYADQITVYVSVLDREAIPPLRRSLEALDTPEPIAIRDPSDDHQADAAIQIGIGLGGKAEFTRSVQRIVSDVKAGEITPENIEAADIEEHLIFPSEPDLVIKTGAERLSDFMIWQSVYSEHYFTDVNWRDFRKRDFLRAVLEFCRRSRRFGR